MAYEHKEGQGSMFQNEKQNDRQPDYKGSIVIEGKTYEIAAWARTSQRGTKYLSLQASLPREQNVPPSPSPSPFTHHSAPDTSPAQYDETGEEDLPF